MLVQDPAEHFHHHLLCTCRSTPEFVFPETVKLSPFHPLSKFVSAFKSLLLPVSPKVPHSLLPSLASLSPSLPLSRFAFLLRRGHTNKPNLPSNKSVRRKNRGCLPDLGDAFLQWEGHQGKPVQRLYQACPSYTNHSNLVVRSTITIHRRSLAHEMDLEEGEVEGVGYKTARQSNPESHYPVSVVEMMIRTLFACSYCLLFCFEAIFIKRSQSFGSKT